MPARPLRPCTGALVLLVPGPISRVQHEARCKACPRARQSCGDGRPQRYSACQQALRAVPQVHTRVPTRENRVDEQMRQRATERVSTTCGRVRRAVLGAQRARRQRHPRGAQPVLCVLQRGLRRRRDVTAPRSEHRLPRKRRWQSHSTPARSNVRSMRAHSRHVCAVPCHYARTRIGTQRGGRQRASRQKANLMTLYPRVTFHPPRRAPRASPSPSGSKGRVGAAVRYQGGGRKGNISIGSEQGPAGEHGKGSAAKRDSGLVDYLGHCPPSFCA